MKNYITLFYLLATFVVSAQKEAQWINFKSGQVTEENAETKGIEIINMSQFPPEKRTVFLKETKRRLNVGNTKWLFGPLSMISDSLGSPLFYSDGEQFWCKDGSYMPGGSLINPDTLYKFRPHLAADTVFSYGLIHFVPVEESCQRYYYAIGVRNYSVWNYGEYNEGISRRDQFYYVKIDAWANNGLGAVIEMKVVKDYEIPKFYESRYGTTFESLKVIKHTDGVSTWVLLPYLNEKSLIYVYLLSSCGIELHKTIDLVAESKGKYDHFFLNSNSTMFSDGKILTYVHEADKPIDYRGIMCVCDFDTKEASIEIYSGFNHSTAVTYKEQAFSDYTGKYMYIFDRNDLEFRQYLTESLKKGDKTAVYTQKVPYVTGAEGFRYGFWARNDGKFYWMRSDYYKGAKMILVDPTLPCPACFISDSLTVPEFTRENNFFDDISFFTNISQVANYYTPKYKTPQLCNENNLDICTEFGERLFVDKKIHADSLLWQVNGNKYMHLPNNSGFFEPLNIGSFDNIKLTKYLGCHEDSFSYRIKKKELIVEDTLVICNEGVIQAENYNDYLYSWSGSNGFEFNGTTPLIQDFGEYQLTIKGACGDIKDSIVVNKKDATYPTVITPNGDFKNDFFVIDKTFESSVHFSVLNRWGAEIFKTDDYVNDWPTQNVSDGTYFIKIEAAKCHYKSWLQILK